MVRSKTVCSKDQDSEEGGQDIKGSISNSSRAVEILEYASGDAIKL